MCWAFESGGYRSQQAVLTLLSPQQRARCESRPYVFSPFCTYECFRTYVYGESGHGNSGSEASAFCVDVVLARLSARRRPKPRKRRFRLSMKFFGVSSAGSLSRRACLPLTLPLSAHSDPYGSPSVLILRPFGARGCGHLMKIEESTFAFDRATRGRQLQDGEDVTTAAPLPAVASWDGPFVLFLACRCTIHHPEVYGEGRLPLSTWLPLETRQSRPLSTATARWGRRTPPEASARFFLWVDRTKRGKLSV